MKILLVLLFTLLNFTALAQEKTPDKKQDAPRSSEETREEQTTEGTKETESEFDIGPYKNGQYQYFGEKELRAREIKQEKEQQ